MTEWFHDGERESKVAIDDRGFQYGDGLFETIAVRHGAPRLWDYHVDRLHNGCERLGLATPDANSLRVWLDAALAGSSFDTVYCAAKIIVTSGVTRRGYGRKRPTPVSVWARAFPSAPPAAARYRDGVDTILCKTRLATGAATAGLKTLNRIEQVLAGSECLAADAFEGLTSDADGRLICGTMSNVFLVRNNDLITPSLTNCGVQGVMRRHVIATLRDSGRDTIERDVPLHELQAADEVFLSNSQFGVLPVRRCNAMSWPVGRVTGDVMDALAANGIAECRQ